MAESLSWDAALDIRYIRTLPDAANARRSSRALRCHSRRFYIPAPGEPMEYVNWNGNAFRHLYLIDVLEPAFGGKAEGFFEGTIMMESQRL